MPSNNHNFYFDIFPSRRVTELYATFAIRAFGLSMLAIFEPLYMYNFFGESIVKVLIYYAVINAGHALFVPLGAKVLTKFGVKHTMLISAPFQILYLVALFNLSFAPWVMVAGIISIIIYKILFWPAMHIDFMRSSVKQQRGREFSSLAIVSSVAAVGGPFIGGLIISTLGFPILFIIVMILLFAALIPLLVTKDIHEQYSNSYQRAFLDLIKKKNWKKTVGAVSQGFELATTSILWPLFLFVLAISISSIGAITSAVLVITIFYTLYIGKLVDSIGRKRTLKIGTFFTSFGWVLVSFIQTTFMAFVIHSFYSIARRTYIIPFMAKVYDSAAIRKDQGDEFIIYREISHNLGKTMALASFAVLFSFTPSFAIAFYLAAAITLFIPLFAY